MAGEKIVGKINEIQGGDVLIIRASGERVIAKAGDVIQEGDTIVASVSSSVAIRVDKNGLASSDGVVIINAGEQAQFDAALFDNTASLISASSQENPVNVGSKPTLDVVRIFNTTFPNSKINATQPDNTNSVIDDPRGENPSLNQDLLLDQNLLPNRNPDIVEKLPGIRGFDLTNEKLPSAPSNRNNPDQNTNDPSQQDDIVELIGNPDNLLPATNTNAPAVTVDPNIVIPNDNSLGLNNDDLLVAENATTTGTFTISALQGITSLQIASTTVSLAQLNTASTGAPIDIVGESFGFLDIIDFDSTTGVVTYSYDPTGTAQDHSGATNATLAENLTLIVTDASATAETITVTLNIGITDTTPTANDDARSISEGTFAIAGNVFGIAASATGDVQDVLIDPNTKPVTAVSNVALNFGSITMSDSGVYTYTLDNTSSDVQGLKGSESLTDVFTYTITDGDGDTDTATLSVTVNGVEDALPTVLAPTNSVTDGSGNTVNGTFTASASAGLTSVTLAAGSGTAQDISGAITGTASSHVTLTGADGNLIVTNFNTATGVVTYNYTENGTLNAATTDNFSIVAVDNESDTDTETLSITIDDLPLVTIPDNNGVSTGEESVVENASGAGLAASFTVSASVGLQTTGTALSLTVDGTTTNLTLAQLNGLGGAPVTITDGNDGNLTLQSFNAASGVVAYTFDPTGTSRDHSGGDESVVEQYSIVATDANGNSNASAEVLDILITDTNPTANDDARSISEGTPAIAGNVVGTASSATGDVSDTLVDSTSSVTDVDFGGTDGTVGTGLAGNYGSIVISSTGVYTYTLDNTSSDVQGLKGSESLTDVFTYTITDGDGDTDTASLTVTIYGVEDALPTVLAPTNSVTDGSGNTVNGTFTASASAGLTSVTLAAGSGTAQDISGAITGTASSHVTLTGADGNLIVTNFNTATGVVTYNYTENGTLNAATTDNFSIVAVIMKVTRILKPYRLRLMIYLL